MSDDSGPWDDYAPAHSVPVVTPDTGGGVPIPHPLELAQINAQGSTPAPTDDHGPWEDYSQAPAAASAPNSLPIAPTAHNKLIGGFPDELPTQASSKLSPQDEATYSNMLKTADAGTLIHYMAQRGFVQPGIEAYVAARDKARAHGSPVSYDVTYALPKIHNQDGAAGAAVRGVGRGASMNFLDEAGAVVDSLGGTGGRENVWNSDKSFGDLYNQNVDYNRAILGGDDEDHPYVSLGGQLLGGLAVPVVGEEAGLTRGMSQVAQDSYRAARLEGFTADEARTVAHSTVARRIAMEGAAYGGVSGAGAADGDPSQRLVGGVEGAVEGGVGGRLIGAVGEHLSPIAYANRVLDRSLPAGDLSDAALVGKAAKRQDIDILPQDVGGRGIARATQGAAQSPFGAKVVGDAADRLYDSFSNRIAKLAGDAPSPKDAGNIVGDRAADLANRGVTAADQTSGAVQDALATPTDTTGAGQLIQRGVSRFIDSTADRASSLYDQVPIAPEHAAQLGSTRRLLNDMTSEWQSNPQLGEIFKNGRLSNFLDALTPNVTKSDTGLLDASGNTVTRDVTDGGSLSWHDLSEFRTRVGDMLADPNLTEKVAPRQLRALYGSLTTDMENTARDAGPDALAQWKRANNFYDGRMKRINDTFSMVLGNKGDATPNEAFAAVQSMLKPGSTGNPAAFGRIMRSMSPEDANTVRASIVDGARGGRQFDPANFSKSWGQLSERGKSALLPQPGMRVMMDDAAGRAALAGKSPFAGLSGEQIFSKLDAMAGNKGDSARFASTMAGLSPDEANAVRSTFINQGGRALPGAQNAEGDAFSISRWFTRWNTMTPEAKNALFGRGELRAAMNDLATVAERVKGSEKLAGHSNTGAINEFSKTTASLWGAAASVLTGHPYVAAGLAAPAVYQRLSAELLTSPRLLRWLTRVPKQADHAGQLSYLSKLSTIAAREPAIANNVIDLRDFLRSAISKSPEQAAAQDEGDRRKEPKYQQGQTHAQQ